MPPFDVVAAQLVAGPPGVVAAVRGFDAHQALARLRPILGAGLLPERQRVAACACHRPRRPSSSTRRTRSTPPCARGCRGRADRPAAASGESAAARASARSDRSPAPRGSAAARTAACRRTSASRARRAARRARTRRGRRATPKIGRPSGVRGEVDGSVTSRCSAEKHRRRNVGVDEVRHAGRPACRARSTRPASSRPPAVTVVIEKKYMTTRPIRNSTT